MKIIGILFWAASFLIFQNARAGENVPIEHSGNFWITQCSSASKTTNCYFFVQGLVKGAIGQAGISNSKMIFCVPDTATNAQMTDVLFKYLTDNPALRHHDVSLLAFKAFQLAFPCAE